ncbi:MAG: hypothetical protein ACXVZJ_05345, partial [Terriglobales bacterium]
GYLIYRLYPQSLVVVDDRHDLYGEELFKSYLRFIHGERGGEEFLREHPAAYVLLPRNSAVGNLLVVTPGWKQIYADDVTISFVRDGGNHLQSTTGN